MILKKIKNIFNKEAYLITIILCLFFVPLFFNPLFVNSFTQGKEILFRLIMIGSLSVFSFLIFQQGSFLYRNFRKSPLAILLIIGGLIFLFTDLASPTPLVTFFGTFDRGFGLITEILLFVLIWLTALNVQKKDINGLLLWAYSAGLLVTIYALFQKIGFDPFFFYYDKDIFVGRVFSFLGNPGYLGQYLLLVLFIGIYLFDRAHKYKTFFGIANGLIFLGILFSGTRASLLSLVICFLIFILLVRKKIYNLLKSVSGKYFSGAIVVLLIIATIAFFYAPKDRFSLSEISTRSIDSRLELWGGAINLIMERPWTGYGSETFYIYAPEIISKQFLTLEENLTLSADRVHNELLELMFSHGIFAGVVYLILFGYLLWLMFTKKNKAITLLCLVLTANFIQNQFSFSDISITILLSFCFGVLIAYEVNFEETRIVLSKKFRVGGMIVTALLSLICVWLFVVSPFMSQWHYAKSINNYSTSYEIAVINHKMALFYTPYYSQLWYELMFLDKSSTARALQNLELIESESGNVLAWKGNYYSDFDPVKSTEYFMKALDKNPNYPNWVRAFADMLYKNGDYENALFLYNQYLELVPDFWKWKGNIDQMSPSEQTSYRIFFKNVPYFWETYDRAYLLEQAFSAPHSDSG